MPTKIEQSIRANALWLKRMREHLGWSTPKLAERVRDTSSRLGDGANLSQQNVSAFENGRHKSNPRWLGYAQIAMLEDIRQRGIHEFDVWGLKLDNSTKSYFEHLHEREGYSDTWDEFPDGAHTSDASFDSDFTDEERQWINVVRMLDDSDRLIIKDLITSLAKRSVEARAAHEMHDCLVSIEGKGAEPPKDYIRLHDIRKEYWPDSTRSSSATVHEGQQQYKGAEDASSSKL